MIPARVGTPARVSATPRRYRITSPAVYCSSSGTIRRARSANSLPAVTRAGSATPSRHWPNPPSPKARCTGISPHGIGFVPALAHVGVDGLARAAIADAPVVPPIRLAQIADVADPPPRRAYARLGGRTGKLDHLERESRRRSVGIGEDPCASAAAFADQLSFQRGVDP